MKSKSPPHAAGSVLPAFRVVQWALVVVPIVAYYALVTVGMPNVPFRDDFNWYVRFLSDYDHATTFLDRLTLVFRQHDQHRIVPLKATTVLTVWLSNQIDFRLLCLVGNTVLVSTYLVWFWRSFRSAIPLYVLVPLGFLWLQPQYWLNILAFNLANFPVNLAMTLTLFALARPSRAAFVVALLLSFLTTCSNGNGLFVYASGGFLLLVEARYRRLAVWLFVAVAAIGWYFTFDGYQFAGHAGGSGILEKLRAGIPTLPVFLWTYLGSFVIFDNAPTAPYVALGLGILMTVPLLASMRYTLGPVLKRLGWPGHRVAARPLATTQLELLRVIQAAYLFVLLTGVVIYLFRSDVSGFPHFPLYDYYKINAVMACGFSIVLAYLLWRPSPWFGIPVFGASFLFWLMSYFTYTDKFLQVRRSLHAEGVNWNLHQRWVLYGPIGMFDNAFANRYTRDLVSRQRYVVPTAHVAALKTLLTDAEPTRLDVPCRVEYEFESFWLKPLRDLPAPLAGHARSYLVLHTDRSAYLLPIDPIKNNWKRALVTRQYFAPTVPPIKVSDSNWRNAFAPGVYDLSIVTFGPDRRWRLPYRWRMAGMRSGLVPADSLRSGS